MNVFEAIKAAVPMREAAEHYGLRVLPNGMACCPFHEDHHPSLKLNEDYFFCFGCGAHGDVIDFTAKLWGLSAQEAVEKLRGDFEIETGQTPIPFPTSPEVAPNLERLCIRVLKEYLRPLRIWRLRYAPVTLGCDPDDRFVESLQMEPVISFFLDSLIAGDSVLRERVLQVFRKDGTIYELRDYVERKRGSPPLPGRKNCLIGNGPPGLMEPASMKRCSVRSFCGSIEFSLLTEPFSRRMVG